MKEPNEDWLDQELKGLPDLEAPPELLPEVMRSVKRRSAQRWLLSIFRQHLPLIKNSCLGLALAVVVLVPLFNPGAALVDFLVRSPVLHFSPPRPIFRQTRRAVPISRAANQLGPGPPVRSQDRIF